jgi:phosphatidylethanolamine N-methyltransferase
MRRPFQQQASIVVPAKIGGVSIDNEQSASSSSSAIASDHDRFVDTPAVSDNEDTDTDASAHRFQHDRRASNASSESTDLDADEEADIHEFGLRSRTPVAANFLPHSPTRAVPKPHLRSRHDLDTYYFRHDQVILKNFDPLRATDFGFAVAMFYIGLSFILPCLSKTAQIATLCANALGWRFIHTFVLGNVLKAQSEKKWMVRHFLKHYHYEGTGFTAVEEAFNNWKSIYNMSVSAIDRSHSCECAEIIWGTSYAWYTVGYQLRYNTRAD